MPFISHIVKKPVVDSDGESLGKVEEVFAIQTEGMAHPVITALAVRNKTELNVYPISEVTVLFSPVISLAHPAKKLKHYTLRGDELPLIDDILDKQILDTNGIRVVRVNDLEITRVGADYYISNVDIGGLGLMRRMGFSKPVEGLLSRLSSKNPQNSISWDYVEPLRHDEFMHLKVPVEKIKELHPADIAELISDMSHAESGQLLNSLDIEHLADALEEVEPDFQANLVRNMPDEKIGLQQDPSAWFERGASVDDDTRIQALIEERAAAKKSRDFARSDAIRDQLASEGVLLEDTPQGVRWKRA